MPEQLQVLERVVGENLEKTQTVSAGLKQVLNESVDDSETDFEIGIAIVVADVQGLFLVSDQDITIETNDGTTPDDTIVLVADVPYFWHAASYHALLLETDVTSIFVTNASGSTANLRGFILVDPTPE